MKCPTPQKEELQIILKTIYRRISDIDIEGFLILPEDTPNWRNEIVQVPNYSGLKTALKILLNDPKRSAVSVCGGGKQEGQNIGFRRFAQLEKKNCKWKVKK